MRTNGDGSGDVFVEVGAADSAPIDLDEDLVGGRWWFGNGFDADVVCGVEAGGLHDC